MLAWRLSTKPATIRSVSTVRGFHGYGGFPKSGFTLIELLVVIGLMALMLAFAIPAFQGASRGGALRTAVFQVNSMMSLARQSAISTRQPVYVVFPDANLSDAMDLAFRSYGVFGRRDGYLSDWQSLPKGVVFYAEPSLPIGRPIPNIFTQDSRFEVTVPFPNQDDAEQQLMALTFRPDGTLGVAGFAVQGVYLTEGIISVDQISPTYLPNAAIFGLEIRPETGQARSREFGHEM